MQIVTKWASVVEKRLAAIGATWPRNAGSIISVTDQAEADRDAPRLLALKAKLGIPWDGLSMEPLLGPVDLGQLQEGLPNDAWPRGSTGWTGSSAARAAPARDRCIPIGRGACAIGALLRGVPFLFKQWGEWLPFSDCYSVAVACAEASRPSRTRLRSRLRVGHLLHVREGDRAVPLPLPACPDRRLWR